MSDSIDAFLNERAVGKIERKLALSGTLELPGPRRSPAFLCLTDRDVLLVAARSRVEGMLLPLGRAAGLRYEARAIGDRLRIDDHAFGVPLRKGGEARELLALGRIRAATPGRPRPVDLRSAFCEKPSTLALEWLSRTLEDEERLLVWLETSSVVVFEEGPVPGEKAPWHYLLTDRCALLAAFSSLGGVRVRELPSAALEVTDVYGRDDVRVGEYHWRTTFWNDSLFRRIAPLPALTGLERIHEAARLQGDEAGDLGERVDLELDYVDHLMQAGRLEQGATLLERLKPELPDERLLDLLPPSGETLVAGGDFRMRRLRLLELLAQARGGQGGPDPSALGELARLEPLSTARIEALEQQSEGDLRERAAKLRAALEPGGLEAGGPVETPFSTSIQAIPGGLMKSRVAHPIEETVGWLGALQKVVANRPAPDTRAIRAFCERPDASRRDDLHRAVTRASLALGTPAPEVFISRGEKSLGLAAYEGAPPLLLVGAAHVDPSHPCWLGVRELQFAVAAELAHLRFKHKRVTAEDVRNGLFDKTGAFLAYSSTALQLLPAGRLAGLIGKGPTYALVRRFATPERLKQLMQVEDGRKLIRAVSSDLEKVTAAGVAKLDALNSSVRSTQGAVTKLIGPGEAPAVTKEATLGVQHRRLIDPCRVMLYTADRAGLLLCDDFAAAVRAMFLVAPEYRAELAVAREFGLARALSRRDAEGRLLHEELVLRVCALASFYLSDDYRVVREALTRPSPTPDRPAPAQGTPSR